MAFEKLEKEKQNKIINAACEVFAKYGYKKASMKDIAEAANVSKSVLFKYFDTKQALYVKLFRLASDRIREADDRARAEASKDEDMFALMRLSAKNRLSLFKEFPWIYKFSYTASFDPDPFVKQLFQKELEAYRQALKQPDGVNPGHNLPDGFEDYRGVRKDISPIIARQIVLWISQGYLEDRLYREDIDPDGLELGFEQWIDVLQLLLKDKSGHHENEE